MIGNAPRSHITGVPGWETPAEQELLVRLAKDVPPTKDGWASRIVELGSEYGMSASLFCYAADPSVFIHCVDLFPGDMQVAHRQNLDAAGFEWRKVIYHQCDSQKGVPHWGHTAQPGINLLFIDADHSYKGAKSDIDAWAYYVKPGGHVAFHDTACDSNPLPHPLHHEVSRAIADWLIGDGKRWRLLETVDSIMVFERLS